MSPNEAFLSKLINAKDIKTKAQIIFNNYHLLRYNQAQITNVVVSSIDPSNPCLDQEWFQLFFIHTDNTRLSKITEVEFQIMRAYMKEKCKFWMASSEKSLPWEQAAIVLLDADDLNTMPYDITFEYSDVLSQFIQNILDLYVPCDNPGQVIDDIKSLYPSLRSIYTELCIEKVSLQSFNGVIKHVMYYIKNIIQDIEFKKISFIALSQLQVQKYFLYQLTSEIESKFMIYTNGHDIIEYMIASVMTAIDMDSNQYCINGVIDTKKLNKSFKVNDLTYLKDTLSEFLNSFTSRAIFKIFVSTLLSNEALYCSDYYLGKQLYIFAYKLKENLEELIDIIEPIPEVSIETFQEETIDFEGLWLAMEAVKADSKAMDKAQTKIYHAYKNYKSAEDKVDSQITKAVSGIKGVIVGDVQSEVIEGKKFSAISLLKKLLGTVAIFSYSKIGGVIAIVTRYALKKQTSISERRKIIMELEAELEIINEKIDDAKGDGNREAKYAMMRTKTQLQNALTKIQYGLEADQKSVATAKQTLSNIRK